VRHPEQQATTLEIVLGVSSGRGKAASVMGMRRTDLCMGWYSTGSQDVNYDQYLDNVDSVYAAGMDEPACSVFVE